MALFYDDLSIGQRFTSAARTVTEADLTQFAMISGDWNQVHTDVEFSRSSGYGQRVVHGLFGLALLTGLTDRMGLFSGSAIAMLGIRKWSFLAPIFIGDTLHCVVEIASMRKTSNGDRGIIDRKFSLINQRGQTVQEGSIALMIRLAPTDDATEPPGELV